MPWTEAEVPDQFGRVAIVTGANTGIGFETARVLAERGAEVVLACRDVGKGEAAAQRIRDAAPSAAVAFEALDLADLDSIAAFAERFSASRQRLDLLINNAGVMVPPAGRTVQGFELQFGINHLGHFALTQELLPLLRGRPDARVVTVSSGAQYFGRIAFDDLQGERRYDRWQAYGQSKLANVMFAFELQRRLDAEGAAVRSLAAHPGVARTNLQPASVAASGSWLEPLAYRLMAPLFQSAAMGALPQLYAATAAEALPAGHYGPDQLGGLRGWPTPVRVAPAALDAAQCQRLWAVSEELCAGVNRP